MPTHKHKKYGYQLFKDRMVTQIKVKSNVKKGEENVFLVKASVHASMKKTQYEVYVHLYQETAKVSLAQWFPTYFWLRPHSRNQHQCVTPKSTNLDVLPVT